MNCTSSETKIAKGPYVHRLESRDFGYSVGNEATPISNFFTIYRDWAWSIVSKPN